ncbi:hypothetical protein JCM3766R1_006365 [Sporobolomyces carnicolor]
MEPLATDRPRHSTRREFVVPASVYTPYYCEENAYNVVKALESTRPGHVRETWACFVSNVDRHAILFEQNASRVGPEQASYVVWDYHVFVVAALNDKDESVIVIDRDSRLGPTVDLRGETEFIHAPPSYGPIKGPLAAARDESHNLWTAFLDMQLEDSDHRDRYGTVVPNAEALLQLYDR